MIYKRATEQLQAAGIDHIVIVKRLWGPSPEYIKVKRQKSRCFDSWQEAVQAVIGGFRPTIIEKAEAIKKHERREDFVDQAHCELIGF